MTHICTLSGEYIDLVNPDPDQIRLLDIIESLLKINRYNGHTFKAWPVSHHTLAMMLHAKDEPVTVRQAILIHDFPEYVLGDQTTPLKHLLNSDLYAELTETWENAICKRFKLGTGDAFRAVFKSRCKQQYDHAAYLAEATLLTNHVLDETPDDGMWICVSNVMDMTQSDVRCALLEYCTELLEI